MSLPTALQNLEFSSTNDRLFIGLLKSLGFTDDSGVPTKRYFDFLDQSQSARILAEAVREAFSNPTSGTRIGSGRF